MENKINASSREHARRLKKELNGRIVDNGLTNNPRWQVSYFKKQDIQQTIKQNSIDWSKTIVIITPKNIGVTLCNGTHYNLAKEKEGFDEVVALALEEKYEEMIEKINKVKMLQKFTLGTDLNIENGNLFYKNQVISSSLAKRIVSEATKKDGSVSKFVKFFYKLYKNPSFKAIEHTYDFLVHNDLEITEEGDIKAWKSVSVIHGEPCASRGVPNWKNWTIEMPRNEVEDDPNKTCSYGLHVASHEYAKDFSELLLEVSFSPEDMVSVPVDYEQQKARTCRYKVLTGLAHPDIIYPVVLTVNRDGEILSEDLVL